MLKIVGDLDYVIETLGRVTSTQLCHVIMVKFVKFIHGMNVSFCILINMLLSMFYLGLCIFVGNKNLVKFCNPLASKIFL